MLSTDLVNLASWAYLAMDENDPEKLQTSLRLIADRIEKTAEQARGLEFTRVGVQGRTVIDLSDPKIALFPVAKRPVPIGDGGAA